MAFNLSSLAVKDTTLLQLRHPETDELLWADDEQTKPVGIHIFGKSSKEYRNAFNARMNRQFKRGKQTLSAEKLQEENIEMLVACSDKAENLELDGKTFTTSEDFRSLYINPAFDWIKTQVDAGIEDVGSFL